MTRTGAANPETSNARSLALSGPRSRGVAWRRPDAHGRRPQPSRWVAEAVKTVWRARLQLGTPGGAPAAPGCPADAGTSPDAPRGGVPSW
jgi:hypothetical protein